VNKLISSAENNAVGYQLYDLAKELFPICRSLTGDGTRATLNILKRELPALSLHEVPSGTKCFDWTVPDEWNIEDAYILDPTGQKIVDFKTSNLHVVGYSHPIDTLISLEELQQHLHSLPAQPDAIPYVTSYYAKRWGFCITHKQRLTLVPGQYHVVIKSTLCSGSLTYGELLIKGNSTEEIFLSTYICHPSLANNELSGPLVQTGLAKWISATQDRRYSYRLIFIPETIGSIVYLSRNMPDLKKNVVAGFNISCVGDDRCFSFLPSRQDNSLSNRVALHVLKHLSPDFKRYTYLTRGSDERQYCSPGVNLPIASIMRSKYGMYPEYHTSLDNLDVISPRGLQGGYDALRLSLFCLENNYIYQAQFPCEPQMGKRGLYSTITTDNDPADITAIMNLLAYADGTVDLLNIADSINFPMWDLVQIAGILVEKGVLAQQCLEKSPLL
jgi:aminopeptidase-like protein